MTENTQGWRGVLSCQILGTYFKVGVFLKDPRPRGRAYQILRGWKWEFPRIKGPITQTQSSRALIGRTPTKTTPPVLATAKFNGIKVGLSEAGPKSCYFMLAQDGNQMAGMLTQDGNHMALMLLGSDVALKVGCLKAWNGKVKALPNRRGD